jgi:hypothetical protein
MVACAFGVSLAKQAKRTNWTLKESQTPRRRRRSNGTNSFGRLVGRTCPPLITGANLLVCVFFFFFFFHFPHLRSENIFTTYTHGPRSQKAAYAYESPFFFSSFPFLSFLKSWPPSWIFFQRVRGRGPLRNGREEKKTNNNNNNKCNNCIFIRQLVIMTVDERQSWALQL